MKLSELIKLAVLKAEGQEQDRLKKNEIAAKVADRKIHLLSEMIRQNVNIN